MLPRPAASCLRHQAQPTPTTTQSTTPFVTTTKSNHLTMAFLLAAPLVTSIFCASAVAPGAIVGSAVATMFGSTVAFGTTSAAAIVASEAAFAVAGTAAAGALGIGAILGAVLNNQGTRRESMDDNTVVGLAHDGRARSSAPMDATFGQSTETKSTVAKSTTTKDVVHESACSSVHGVLPVCGKSVCTSGHNNAVLCPSTASKNVVPESVGSSSDDNLVVACIDEPRSLERKNTAIHSRAKDAALVLVCSSTNNVMVATPVQDEKASMSMPKESLVQPTANDTVLVLTHSSMRGCLENMPAHDSARIVHMQDSAPKSPAKGVPELAPMAGMISADGHILAMAQKGVVLIMDDEDEEDYAADVSLAFAAARWTRRGL
ncbi:hypothetical protein AMAG_18246 [Allomyces macrogynus ATCC 38327]|uniref:Uncharacterized protein n=1 Tax=Allomyces macrogynus (strain ATCC 38327) TaxID=578462 RepID=A0A0L0S7M8_ALLM3|nr:hypothetical protein AMAG_18246 [Allomyces macrogynus ATCC 38327]|eukprot:KNE58430.1 hypothetical protein AMAG_18246 [Allomyces macrogynus ATCC 38327]